MHSSVSKCSAPKQVPYLHEIFATSLFRDFDVRIFRDT